MAVFQCSLLLKFQSYSNCSCHGNGLSFTKEHVGLARVTRHKFSNSLLTNPLKIFPGDFMLFEQNICSICPPPPLINSYCCCGGLKPPRIADLFIFQCFTPGPFRFWKTKIRNYLDQGKRLAVFAAEKTLPYFVSK